MGLDGVEIVIELEDRFRIRPPDGAWQSARTVADVAAVVIAHLGKPLGPCPTARSFYRLRRTIAEHTALAREQIRPSTPLTDVLPAWRRRAFWDRLRAAGHAVPPLGLPVGWSRPAGAAGGLVLLAAAVAPLWLLWATPVTALATSVVVFICIAVGLGALLPLVYRWPTGLLTAGELARAATPTPLPSEAGAGLIAEQRILREVRQIIAEQMGRPLDAVRPESRLVEDLGLG